MISQIETVEIPETVELTAAEIAAELRKEELWNRNQVQLKLAKPCPFCGGEAGYCADGLTHSLGCRNEDCAVQPEITMYLSLSTVLKLVQGWNTRAA